MGRSERVHNYVKWHRELRAKMIEAKFPGIDDETSSIKWIVRVIAAHHHYGQLACAWRAAGPPTTISEIEAIMSNDKAEVDRQKKIESQLQTLMKKAARHNNR